MLRWASATARILRLLAALFASFSLLAAKGGGSSSSCSHYGLSTSDLVDEFDRISSVSVSQEDDVIDKFHTTVREIIRLYSRSLGQSLRRKRKLLLKYLLTPRGLGESQQMDLIKEWAVASLSTVKDRAEHAHKRLKASITERWQYGRKERWRRNRFISGQRPNNKEEVKEEGGRIGRLRHLRDDRGDIGDIFLR